MAKLVGELARTGTALLIRILVIAGVISGDLLYIKQDVRAGSFEQQAIIAGLLLCAMFGALLSGCLADHISRKWARVISRSVYDVGALGCASSVNAEMSVGLRFLLGPAGGTASFVSPLCMSEASPPEVSKGVVSRNGQPDNARGALDQVREEDPDTELDAEMAESEEANDQEKDAFVRDLVQPRFRPLLSGRLGRHSLLLTGAVGLLFVLRLLGVHLSSTVLQSDYGWLALAGLVLFIASFAIGLGPVFWLMISEIFPVGVRGPAMSVCTIGNWGANFLVAQTFLTLSDAITRQGVFFLYAALAVASLVFFGLRVPETSSRSLEDIQEELTGGYTS